LESTPSIALMIHKSCQLALELVPMIALDMELVIKGSALALLNTKETIAPKLSSVSMTAVDMELAAELVVLAMEVSQGPTAVVLYHNLLHMRANLTLPLLWFH